jgi:hypothetical protein
VVRSILLIPDLDLVAIAVNEPSIDQGQLTNRLDPITMLSALATATQHGYGEH